MNFFKKLFSKPKETEASTEDPFKNSPIFKRMMEDMQKERDSFSDKFEKIFPILKPGRSMNQKIVTSDGIEHDLPYGSLPVIQPLEFDELSIVFGIDQGTHFEWLQNKHIEVAKDKISIDDLVNKSYQNLIFKLNNKISMTMVNSDIGILNQCQGFESSLILYPDTWEIIVPKLNATDIIFGIPTQDVFIFVDSKKIESVKTLREKVADLYNNPAFQKKISPSLFIRRESGLIEKYRG